MTDDDLLEEINSFYYQCWRYKKYLSHLPDAEIFWVDGNKTIH